MKFRLFSVAALCALAFALVVTPAVAQAGSSDRPMAASDDSSQIVPGTGVTMAELRDLGWSQDQIAEMKETAAKSEASAGMSTDTGKMSEKDEQPNAARTESAAADTGGSNWGLWGLLGLLGLLGLGGRSRREVLREDRDIRRVA